MLIANYIVTTYFTNTSRFYSIMLQVFPQPREIAH